MIVLSLKSIFEHKNSSLPFILATPEDSSTAGPYFYNFFIYTGPTPRNKAASKANSSQARCFC